MINLDTAISTLVSEYDRFDGVLTEPVNSRRAAAMDGVSGGIFKAIAAEADPHGINHLDEDFAERTLSGSLFLSGLMVGAMLDFRQKAAQHGYSPDSYRDTLQRTLLEIWDHFQQDLLGFLDTLDQDDTQGDDGDDDGDEAIES